jgi:hypothetical protein
MRAALIAVFASNPTRSKPEWLSYSRLPPIKILGRQHQPLRVFLMMLSPCSAIQHPSAHYARAYPSIVASSALSLDPQRVTLSGTTVSAYGFTLVLRSAGLGSAAVSSMQALGRSLFIHSFVMSRTPVLSTSVTTPFDRRRVFNTLTTQLRIGPHSSLVKLMAASMQA